MTGRILSALLLLAAAGVARADEAPPLKGDIVNGGARYRLDCAACHGLTGNGDGPLAEQLNPHPARLRDGSYLWSHSGTQILQAMTGEALANGATPAAHQVPVLEAHDILAWLEQPIPELSVVFPRAVEFIAHQQKIDRDGQQRAERILDRALTPSESKIMVFTIYGADQDSTTAPDGHPTKVGEDPTSLYNAKPRRRLGYATYQTLDLTDGPVDVLLAMNNDSKLISVRTLPSDDAKVEKARARIEKVLREYIGSGGRMDKKPIAPQRRGAKAPKDVQMAMTLAFERLLEGDAMFQKEERNRFALDPDAFTFPQAQEQPEDVKFDFKEKKQR